MLKEEDWSNLYYAVVKKYDRGGKVQILGVGSTKLIARNEAIEYTSHFVRGTGADAMINAISFCDVDSFSRITSDGNGEIGIMYCEAKVYIYGHRYGFDGISCILDPTYRDNLLRFAGYDDKEKKRLENGRERNRRKYGI